MLDSAYICLTKEDLDIPVSEVSLSFYIYILVVVRPCTFMEINVFVDKKKNRTYLEDCFTCERALYFEHLIRTFSHVLYTQSPPSTKSST